MNQAKHAALDCVNYDNVDYRKKKKDGCMSHSSCLFCDTVSICFPLIICCSLFTDNDSFMLTSKS